jgi:hypothetical protein
MSLFDYAPEGRKMLRAPSFRLFSGERVGDLNPQSSLYRRGMR